MNIIKDRTIKILDILSDKRKIKLSFLTELMDVSHVTLRKDLEFLEKRGILCRSHGYISLEDAKGPGRRIAYKYSVKRRIAKAAAQIVEEGETVLIESGSCCAIFAEELALSKKNVTIITNSAFIANYISNQSNIKIILLGGYFQPDSQTIIGPMTAKCAEILYADKFFLGADGFVSNFGFTGRDFLRVETSIELAKHSKKVFILTESDKFNRRGTFNMLQFDQIDGIYTDDNIPKEAELILLKENIKLHKVPSVEEKVKVNKSKFPGVPLYKSKSSLSFNQSSSLS